MDYPHARVRLCPCNDETPQATIHHDGTLTCSECGATMETETDMHSNDTRNVSIFEHLFYNGDPMAEGIAAARADARILDRNESTRTAADAMLIANELRETADLYMEDEIDIEDLREQNKITWTEARRLNVVETVRTLLRNRANLTNEGR